MSSNRNASARKSRLAMMARRQFLAAGLALTAALSLRRNTDASAQAARFAVPSRPEVTTARW